jgi:hypothetical protein
MISVCKISSLKIIMCAYLCIKAEKTDEDSSIEIVEIPGKTQGKTSFSLCTSKKKSQICTYFPIHNSL